MATKDGPRQVRICTSCAKHAFHLQNLVFQLLECGKKFTDAADWNGTGGWGLGELEGGRRGWENRETESSRGRESAAERTLGQDRGEFHWGTEGLGPG